MSALNLPFQADPSLYRGMLASNQKGAEVTAAVLAVRVPEH